VKILHLSPWYPYPPVNGSKNRIYHLAKAMSSAHRLEMIACVRPGEAVDSSGLEGLVESITIVPWKEYRPNSSRAIRGFFSPTPRSYVDAFNPDFQLRVQYALNTNAPDLVVASEIWTAMYIRATTKLPAILDDLEFSGIHDQWKNARSNSSRLRRRLTWYKTSHYLEKLLQQFTFCTVVSDQEKDLLHPYNRMPGRLQVIPNGVDLDYFAPGHANPVPGTLIYPGSLAFPANYDAVAYFLAEIYPSVERGYPDVKFTITGAYNQANLSGLMLRPSCTLTGFLDDVRPAMASAWACIVPLRQGSGTRLKILEALALGVPVITTSKGMEGLDLIPEEHLLVADQPAEFAGQVMRLFHDTDLHERLSEAGRKRVKTLYDWETISTQFLALIDRVTSSKVGLNAVDQ